ncbi:hypothetical protein METBIDRAFT_208005 [Metschnikowia bicuspidata var. bicuspidata NRRL YB-4993]|uniref:Uncharacterized protein n=1 Tax=Metschnikowia bicuspidata var. bicuspidata NRRL YB-4993 TaxID=869754 RepID=A0A1A0H6Y7_9ASCO|nr:hypothetical protein METBIDRAFT_208005 [Metschnikowia bicuspidata var. bicuspidata NRRL YB-4993]OBA19796.1 hypothetical protein METBIDRAFT_208005 [Metschnikowia bicuspidata var. bicuspidata NRRL YB-4993]
MRTSLLDYHIYYHSSLLKFPSLMYMCTRTSQSGFAIDRESKTPQSGTRLEWTRVRILGFQSPGPLAFLLVQIIYVFPRSIR